MRKADLFSFNQSDNICQVFNSLLAKKTSTQEKGKLHLKQTRTKIPNDTYIKWADQGERKNWRGGNALKNFKLLCLVGVSFRNQQGEYIAPETASENYLSNEKEKKPRMQEK